MGRNGGPPTATLSRREQEVAALVAEGLTNRVIAQRMFISERTVDGHLEHIREKLGVSNRAQVAAWFVAQGATSLVATPPAAIPRTRRSNLWLAILAAAVLTLVVGVTIYERLTPPIPAGPALTTFKSPNPQDQLCSCAWSVTIGGDGAVYIADPAHQRILKVDPIAGSITTFAGGHAGDFIDGSDRLDAHMGFPIGIALAPGGGLYFATSFGGPGMVGRIDPDSTVHYVAGAKSSTDSAEPIRDPEGLASTLDGTLYISDVAANRVWKLTLDGTLTLFAGNGQEGPSGDGGAATAAELDLPRGLAIEADGDVLIADADNNRIREVIHGTGEIVTVAGSGDYYGFSGDGGPGTKAKFSLPWGVAVAPDGTIYIADAGNDRVRSIDAHGVVRTVVHNGLTAPAGLAVTSSGDLYVVGLGDPWLHRVHLAEGAHPT